MHPSFLPKPSPSSAYRLIDQPFRTQFPKCKPLLAMPATLSRPSNQPTPRISREGIRTAIIVCVVIGLLAIAILCWIVLNRRRNRGVKSGMKLQDPHIDDGREKDLSLETGVVHEPLPVYQKERLSGETTLVTASDAERRRLAS
jgi:hypothetical protein